MLKESEKYMYGVFEIDSEHSELIARAEKLMASYQNGEAEAEILKLFEYLSAYVLVHFRNEEKLLGDYGYPELDAHKELHREFKQDVMNLQDDIKENGLTLNSRLKLTHLTTEWIDHHIGTEDKKIANFILNIRKG
ncbi:bacteriohemerythrin [Fusibacter bizertensis]|uniref:Bacteriohemerythrin n=1 Tax=Fusibacter bizertensis TaxID=1488331 RepID=A0ABT6NEY3_9FIRM|nr:bacteriohemerythrin [Fusibacter bizertensis]MDH8678984.1 bacteriohemerythrin [Fusibacter bizertensis]